MKDKLDFFISQECLCVGDFIICADGYVYIITHSKGNEVLMKRIY